jgi:hypothetical protein
MVRTLEGDWEVWAGTEDGVFTTIVWPGVEERFASLAQRVTAGATFVRGVLHLGAGTVPERGLSRAVLLDAAGRTAMALKPGPNDVRHLPAGVYFVRPSGTVPAGQGTVPIRAKAVIQR